MHMKSRQTTANTSTTDSKPRWFEDAINTHKHQAKYLGKILTMKESLARQEEQQQQQSAGFFGKSRTGVGGGIRDSGTTASSSSRSHNYPQSSSANTGFPNKGAKTKSREIGKVRSPPDMYPIDVVQGRAVFDKGSGQTQMDKQAKWWRSGSLEERHLIKRSSKDMPKILPPMSTIPAVDRRSGYCEKLKSYSATFTGSKVIREESERDKMIDLKMTIKKSGKAMCHNKGAEKSKGKLCKTKPPDRSLRRTQSLDFRCELAPVRQALMDTDSHTDVAGQSRYRSHTYDYPGHVDTLAKQNSLSELMDKMDVLEGAAGGSADVMEYSDASYAIAIDEPMPEDAPDDVLVSDAEGRRHQGLNRSVTEGETAGRSFLEVSDPRVPDHASSDHHGTLQRRHTLPIINLRPPTPRLNDREEKTLDVHIGRILRKVVCQSVIRKRELSRLCEDIEEFNEINSALTNTIQR